MSQPRHLWTTNSSESISLLRAILLPIILGVFLPLCAHGEPVRDVTIGGLFDLTGSGAIWGKTESKAFQLACRDFEAKNPEVHVHPQIDNTMF